MRSSTLVMIAATLCCAVTGCAVTQTPVRVDKSETVDVAKCETFAWLPATKDAASFTEQRVRTAVMQQLEAKGYRQANETPDCRVTYVLAVHERPKQKPRVGVGAGGGSGGVGGGIGVSIPIGQRDQHVGEFTLDVVDVASNSQIWSGSIDAAFEAAELSEEEANEVVEIVLAELPSRK